jgi:hypothetical protein
VSGLEVTKDLRDGDAEIVGAAFNQLIAWVCELNFGGGQAPVFSLWDQKDQDTLQATRDKSNYEAGARYTNAYWQRSYGYQEGDLQSSVSAMPSSVVASQVGNPAFAEAIINVDTTDPTLADTNTLMQVSAPMWHSMVGQIQALVDNAASLAQLQQTLTQIYGGIDTDQLVKLMAAALALAELKGMVDAQAESAT